MSKLSIFLTEYAKQQFKGTTNADMKSEALAYELERTFKDEILNEEADRINRKAERLRIIKGIDRTKDLFRTVVVIGIMVGVTSNQITALLSIEQYGILARLVFIIALVAVMYIFFHFQYLREANKMIEEFKGKSDGN